MTGNLVGDLLGEKLGLIVGATGRDVGALEGCNVGTFVGGTAVGLLEGIPVGDFEGDAVGATGRFVGAKVGNFVGERVGDFVAGTFSSTKLFPVESNGLPPPIITLMTLGFPPSLSDTSWGTPTLFVSFTLYEPADKSLKQ